MEQKNYRIVPMNGDHLDQIERLERLCFSRPWNRRMLAEELPGVKVMTQDEIGLSSDAKEAIAFAIMGNETMYGYPSNVCSATGASRPVILGNITPAPRKE